ncbi:hypothetical protein MP638_002633, partial [Amoeboaphelidium occidentale]
WNTSDIKPLNYEPQNPLFELDTNYLAGAGLFESRKIILYCRPQFHAQFKFLRERVIDNGRLGWIMGPPGTGKSTTALAFASTLDNSDWTVTWVHLDREGDIECVRYENGKKKTCYIEQQTLEKLDAILDEVDDDRKHIVFIDGFALKGDKHTDIQRACTRWRERKKDNRRLVVVCSMSSRGKEARPHVDLKRGIEEMFVYSWKLEEYLAAIHHNAFFENVKDNLDAEHNSHLFTIDLKPEAESKVAPVVNEAAQVMENTQTVTTARDSMIRSKFYFAGGCCRYMFQYKTATVMDDLERAIGAATDVVPYVTGTIGELSDRVVNRLFSHHENSQMKIRRTWSTSIVSEWAALELAMRHGPELVKNLAAVTRLVSNPSFDGWLLEMWFFASLCKGGVELFDKNGAFSEKWHASVVFFFSVMPSLPDKGIWLKPAKWNQGGYDAIFINKEEELVRFVQITRAESHSFKMEFFHEFLSKLAKSPSSFEIKRLEIVFLVLKEKMNEF